jgi:ribosomal protein S18 acetylase RimI-like enzyme
MTERPFTEGDLGAFAEMWNALEESVLGRPGHVDAKSVAGWLGRGSSLLIEDEHGPAAGVLVDVRGPIGIYGGVVHPRAHGRGHGSRLAEFAEEWIEGQPAEKVHTFTLAGDTAADELFTGHGYREVRRFWDMAIDLGAEPPPAAVLEIETFRGGDADAQAFHDALDEAFSDHWEHHSRGFDEWWEEKRAQPDYDPSLWFLIRDGDEVAAVVRNDPDRQGGGYVGALGVRRPWRGKGYGKALLQHSFREFHRRGQRRVSLGVDAASPTGATRLYESVGMRVELESVVYEKVLT